ncbi:MAG: hypothetical protein ACLFRD_07780 [Nitriliruptoraceae bacterium]
MRGLIQHLRLWMRGMLVVVATLEVVTALPGWWAVGVYGFAFISFGLVMFAVIIREGRPMGDRSRFRHGDDMHGHYR